MVVPNIVKMRHYNIPPSPGEDNNKHSLSLIGLLPDYIYLQQINHFQMDVGFAPH